MLEHLETVVFALKAKQGFATLADGQEVCIQYVAYVVNSYASELETVVY